MTITSTLSRASGTFRFVIRHSSFVILALLSGCLDPGDSGAPELVWGQRGQSPGRLQKPRAIAIDADDNLYLVDMTARIQVFTPEGEYLRGWQTPEQANGRPTGLTIGRDGKVLVADTHYYRVLIYSPQGGLLKTIGGKQGHGPGEFGFVTDVVQDSQGNYYVSEYGDYDRIQKFTPQGDYVLEWGSNGSEPGQFRRPQNMEIDEQDRIWVCDAGNHRVQVFDTSGKLVQLWGQSGREPGQLYYPYDLAFGPGGEVYVIEYGNHRVQKFTRDGQSLATWGTHGREPGQLHNAWGIVCDSEGRMHVLDTNNHRVQRVRF
jgi:DNA-binding beta-propeller fold protein YncE